MTRSIERMRSSSSSSCVHALADLSKSPSYAGDNLFVDTEPVRRLSRDLRRMPTPSSEEDLDELESLLVDLRQESRRQAGAQGKRTDICQGGDAERRCSTRAIG